MAESEFVPKNIITGLANPNKNPPATFFPAAKKAAPPAPAPVKALDECVPANRLSWKDYTGAVPAGANFAAMTASGIRRVNNQGKDWFQAFFEPAQSWVQPWNLTPGNNAVNDCQKTITAMETYVKAHPGETVRLNPPPLKCAATILPKPVAVRTVAEATTIFGVECSKSKIADSNRLLAHEQLHFDISCLLAKKANQLLRKGIDFGVVGTAITDIYTKINVDNGSGAGDYDQQTDHGCNQGKQNDWQTKVTNGLQDYKIDDIGAPAKKKAP